MQLVTFVRASLLISSIRGAQLSSSGGIPVPDVTDHILLERYHLEPSKEGFLAALQHSQSSVRSFAALRLAADGEKDAVPDILAALAAETVPGVQINLAISIARLGSEKGIAALKTMCEHSRWDGGLRMGAAQAMRDLKREECEESVLDAVRSPDSDTTLYLALYLMPRFQGVPPGDLEYLKQRVAGALENPSAAVRLAASHVLRENGGSWAIELLRARVAAESDPGIRGVLASDLAAIEAAQKSFH